MDEKEQWLRDFAEIEADTNTTGNKKSAYRELRDTVIDELRRELDERLKYHAREHSRQVEDEYNRYLQRRDEFHQEYEKKMAKVS